MKKTLIEASEKAGEILLENFHKVKSVRVKGRGDIVTNVDLQTEKTVKQIIQDAFPDHGFLGEEFGESKGNSEFVWIVDPLDGTTNYSRGIPLFNTSIAVARKGEVFMGAVNCPVTQELFFAEKGNGATLNGKKIKVSEVDKVEDSFLSFCDGHTLESKKAALDYFMKLKLEAIDVRKLGSAALELSLLACGRLDGFFSLGTKAWDVAAGTLIIQEAGGKVTDFEGKQFSLDKSSGVVASNKRIHAELLKILK